MIDYTPKYLVMVSSQNNNKYYKMIPQGDTFRVEFGRVGGSSQVSSYSKSQFEKKYNEKIRKGYVDRTSLMEDLIQKEEPKAKTPDGFREIENKAIAEIVERLQAMAKKVVAENYNVTSDKVTMAMVDEAQRVLARIVVLAGEEATTVEVFNRELLELFGVIPRKMSEVSAHMARSRDDFGRIVEHEQDLLDVMKGQVYVPPARAVLDVLTPDTVSEQTILEDRGLVFEEATPEDIIKIKSCLGSCEGKFYRAWRVRNLRTQNRFDSFVSDGDIKTKLLWHGSRNENWWSIINSGLVLKPTNAVITGKMFGYGIYFATKAQKSLGYTSLSGSYWARGSSSSAFMGLYEVAYGTPYDVHSFASQYGSLTYDKLQQMCPGAHCVHAHEGQMLRNDEIIVYQECQTTIKYLVELR